MPASSGSTLFSAFQESGDFLFFPFLCSFLRAGCVAIRSRGLLLCPLRSKPPVRRQAGDNAPGSAPLVSGKNKDKTWTPACMKAPSPAILKLQYCRGGFHKCRARWKSAA
jgi:hypothetical protein